MLSGLNRFFRWKTINEVLFQGELKMQKLDSVEQFEQVLKTKDSFLILKHSLTCPISQGAYDEYNKFSKANPDYSSYYLVVQDSRPLANYIAETFNVKHESPQALLFTNKSVTWHTSHWKITYDVLNEIIQGNK